jgi:cobalamin-dependent methionine synthase I
MLIIGERINSSRKAIFEAIASRDADVIKNEAKAQDAAGADYIDVNAGAFAEEEAELLKWVIDVVQTATDLPLCIDSPDPAVIRSVIPLLGKPPMINSVTLEPARLEGILPLAVACKAKLIGLCQSEESMAESTEAKVEFAGELIGKVTTGGLALDDFYVDPLVYPLSTDDQSGLSTLNAIERIMAQYPGIHTTCGLTNVSYGLPDRKCINRAFLVAAISRGLDSAIVDPTDNLLYGSLKAALLINGKDESCMEYISAYRSGRLA